MMLITEVCWRIGGQPSSGNSTNRCSLAAYQLCCPTSETRRPRCDPFQRASSRLSRVAGTPELGPLGIDPSRGGPLADAQAGKLVGAEEAPEL